MRHDMISHSKPNSYKTVVELFTSWNITPLAIHAVLHGETQVIKRHQASVSHHSFSHVTSPTHVQPILVRTAGIDFETGTMCTESWSSKYLASGLHEHWMKTEKKQVAFFTSRALLLLLHFLRISEGHRAGWDTQCQVKFYNLLGMASRFEHSSVSKKCSPFKKVSSGWCTNLGRPLNLLWNFWSCSSIHDKQTFLCPLVIFCFLQSLQFPHVVDVAKVKVLAFLYTVTHCE